MNAKSFVAALSSLVALLLLLTGCGGGEEFDPNKPFTLPGADKVLQGLQSKDYEATVAALAQIRASITPKDKDEYRRLREKVLDQLVAEMGDSEAAKNAYRAIGMMETGR